MLNADAMRFERERIERQKREQLEREQFARAAAMFKAGCINSREAREIAAMSAPAEPAAGASPLDAPRWVLLLAAAGAAAMGVHAACEAVRLILSASGY